MPLQHSPPNKTSYLWALRKSSIIEELNKYQIEFDPGATLAELRIILRNFIINLKKTVPGSKENSCTNLLKSIEIAERVESEELEAGIKNPPSHPNPVDNIDVQVVRKTDSTQSTPTLRRSERLNPTASRSADDLFNQDIQEDSDSEEEEILCEIERELEIKFKHEQAEKRRIENERKEAALRQQMAEQIRAEFEMKQAEKREKEKLVAREQRKNALKERVMSWWGKRFGSEVAIDKQSTPVTENIEDLKARLEKEIRADLEKEYGLNNENRQVNAHYEPTTFRRNEMDVRDQVRKWGVTFDGGKGLQDFIERVDEMSQSYGIRGSQVIQCIPILLKDKALLWYRNNKRNWATWEEFVTDLKLFYMPSGVDIQLEEEIRNRTQGPKEPAKEYITKLQTLMRRHGQMSETARLERLYHNLRPEYKKYIKRTEFKNVNGLIQLCDTYEQLLIQEATYKPPKNHSVIPETVYNVSQGKKRKENDNMIINEYDHRRNCWKCGETGHIQSGCRNIRVLMCIFCGTRGRDTQSCNCTRPGNDQGAGTKDTGRPMEQINTTNKDQQGPREGENPSNMKRSHTFTRPQEKSWARQSRSFRYPQNPPQPNKDQQPPQRYQQPRYQPPPRQYQHDNQSLTPTDSTPN